MRLRAAVFATLLGLVSASVARVAGAQGLVWNLPLLGPTAFTFTDTTLVGFRGSDFGNNPHNRDFFFLTERLDIAVQAAPWRLYVRLDGFSPWNQDTSCAGPETSLCYLRSNYRPERVSLRYQRGDITAEVGDFYQVFGRGIALAFRKVDPLGLDTALRGGRFEYDRGRMTVRAFAGQGNPQNLDPVTLQVFPDPADWVAGGSTAVRVGPDEDIEFSGHAVHTHFEALESGSQDDIDVAGFRADLPSLLHGDLTFYGEFDSLLRRSVTRRATTSTPGRAFYAAAQLVRGPFTLLIEWKDYTHYLVAPTENNNSSPQDLSRLYSAAPSLERDDQRPYTNANVRGGRVRLDYNIPTAPWIITANTLWYGWADSYNDATGLPMDPWDAANGIVTTHTYIGLRRRTRIGPVTPAGGGADAGSNNPGSSGAGVASGAAGASSASLGAVGAAGIGSAGAVQRVSAGDYALNASIGYRREFHMGTDPTGTSTLPPQFVAGDIKHESIQADIDVAFPIGANDSIDLRIDNWFQRTYTFDRIPAAFNLGQIVSGVRGGIGLSWAHGSPLVVSALLRWDNTGRPTGMADLGDRPFGMLSPVAPPVLYPAGEVRWNFTPGNFIRLFGGMTPGGRICSGGVCRDVPLYQGALAELVLRI